MSLIDGLDPILQPWAQRLFDLAEAAGVRPRITSGRRSRASQEQLYKAFLAGHSHYPAAAPGSSAHEYGLAFDMLVQGSVNQSDCGVVWRSWGGRYGGEEDPIHFEYPGFNRSGIASARPTQETPSSTAGSIQSKIFQLADEIALAVPSPLRGILNTAIIANALANELGSPYSLGIEWMLTHPAELTSAFVTAARNILLGRT